MLTPITIRYPFRPIRRSLATARVADLFGLSADEPPHTVAENLALDVRPGDLVLFTGPSGSGKSSLLREAGRQLHALDIAALDLPDVPLIDALPGPVDDWLATLAACGLSEARLLLRTPAELSDGQRYRFLIAYAMSSVISHQSLVQTANAPGAKRTTPASQLMTNDQGLMTLQIDEFAAVLDRTTAKVLAFNLRRQVSRTGVGALCATTHDDLADDLNPDLHIRCLGDGVVDVQRREVKKKWISFANDLWLSTGTKSDWPYFARWHYRGRQLAYTRRVILLWHRAEPIGICVYAAPVAALSLRSKYFGLKNPCSRVALAALNEQLWLLQRVVLHPTYRGAGIAAAFVRRACELCPADWIETLSVMGHANPFFERAGFTRVGEVRSADGPVYYVFDNRGQR